MERLLYNYPSPTPYPLKILRLLVLNMLNVVALLLFIYSQYWILKVLSINSSDYWDLHFYDFLLKTIIDFCVCTTCTCMWSNYWLNGRVKLLTLSNLDIAHATIYAMYMVNTIKGINLIRLYLLLIFYCLNDMFISMVGLIWIYSIWLFSTRYGLMNMYVVLRIFDMYVQSLS